MRRRGRKGLEERGKERRSEEREKGYRRRREGRVKVSGWGVEGS